MKHSNKLKPILLAGLFIIVVEAIGSLSGILAGDIKSIYNNLQLPVWYCLANSLCLDCCSRFYSFSKFKIKKE